MPIRALPINQFVAEDEVVEWLVADLLPSTGWTLLVGEEGLGKSTFCMQMCAAIHSGVPFLGRPTKPRSILYVQADSSSLEWREMLKRIAPTSTGYTMVDVPSNALDNPKYIDDMLNLRQLVRPGFVVFDSLYNLTSVAINTEKVLTAVSIMRQIAGGVPWLLIHHPRKQDSSPSGHRSLPANCSNHWGLRRNMLKIEKGRLVKNREILLSRDQDGLWEMKESSRDSVEDQLRSVTF